MSLQLQIECRVYEEMVAHARREAPNECCGLLAGKLTGVLGEPAVASRCYPLVNELASPVEFLSEPRSMFEAEKDRRRRGLEILAVYHSHPLTEPMPSKKDLQLAYPGWVHLIISLRDGEPRASAWQLSRDDFREVAWAVIPAS